MDKTHYADEETLAELGKLRKELFLTQNECEEQARLLGMSGSREAKLLAEIDTLRNGWIALQCDIANLIPATDGERANDSIVGRVQRVTEENKRLEDDIEAIKDDNYEAGYKQGMMEYEARLVECSQRRERLEEEVTRISAEISHINRKCDHLGMTIRDIKKERDDLKRECQQTAWLRTRVEQLEAELFESRKFV